MEPDASPITKRLRFAVEFGGGPTAVAGKSGVPYGTLRNYLLGREMKVDAMVAIAEACDVTVEWLAAGRGNIHPLKDSEPDNSPVDMQPIPIKDTDKLTSYGRQVIDIQHLAASLKIRFELTPPSKPMTWREFALGVAFFYEVSTPTSGDTALADEFVPFCAQPNDVGQT